MRALHSSIIYLLAVILQGFHFAQPNGQQIDIKGSTPFSVQQNISVSQMIDSQYFSFSNNDNDFTGLQYLVFDFYFDQTDNTNIIQNLQMPPLLCYSLDSNLNIIDSNNQIDISKCNGFNFNQFTRVNGMYSITINIPDQSTNYVKVLFFISGAQVTYTMVVKAQYNGKPSICPFDCANPYTKAQRGSCTSSVCNCNVGYIDEDCSTGALLITDKQQKMTVDSLQMNYAYYLPSQPVASLKDASDIQIQINLSKDSPAIGLFVSIQGVNPKKIVPTTEIYLMRTLINSSNYNLILKGSAQYDISGNPKYTVFGFLVDSQNYKSSIIQVSVDGDSSSISTTNLLIIYFLVGIVALLFLIWIILTIIKIRYARRNQILDLTMAQAQINAAQQRVSQRRGQSNKLTMDIIDEFLPAMAYEEIQKKSLDKGKTISDSCAVCLCEFENSDMCRETICNHFFHKDCLEQWLKKQENCPFCRTDLQRKSLIQHFNQLKNVDGQDSNNQKQQGENIPNSSNANNVHNESQPLRNQSYIPPSIQPSNLNLIRNNSQFIQASQEVSQNVGQRRSQNQLNIVQRNPSQQHGMYQQNNNVNENRNNINIVNEGQNNRMEIQNFS